MKKLAKYVSLLTITVFGLVGTFTASAKSVGTEASNFCSILPWSCSVTTSGAGGTGHGGDKDKPKDDDKLGG